ncbi:alpha/beta hydrolase fold-3 domain-containing protein [Xylariaceae sp. AK1471]|nr:alpha/beta hydrolase fold-3 domain-containing protein [Xylariaceae sp. AK1471]
MAPIWSLQPFKTIFTVFFMSTSMFYLAVFSLRYVLKPLRPLPEWSYKTSIGVKILRTLIQYYTTIRFQRPRQLKPGKSKDRFILIEPPNASLFSGALIPTTVHPTPVGAVWHPAAVCKTDFDLKSRKVSILVPGGAFVLGWDPEELGAPLADVLTSHLGVSNVLYVQYRLAGPKTPFPAAVQDLLTSYYYVLDLGVLPENITLVGDSAGGNLIIAFLRHLETGQTLLPRPGGVLSFSPWVEVTPHSRKKYEQSAAARIDILDGPLLTWGATAYTPEGKLSQEAAAYISPLHRPFPTKTPLFIQAGGREGLLDSISKFTEEMSEMEGNRVRFHLSEHMPHDILLTYSLLGLEAEVEAVLEDACRFFTKGLQ